MTGFLMKYLKQIHWTINKGAHLKSAGNKSPAVLDLINPDLSPFYQRGGKLMVVI